MHDVAVAAAGDDALLCRIGTNTAQQSVPPISMLAQTRPMRAPAAMKTGSQTEQHGARHPSRAEHGLVEIASSRRACKHREPLLISEPSPEY